MFSFQTGSWMLNHTLGPLDYGKKAVLAIQFTWDQSNKFAVDQTVSVDRIWVSPTNDIL